mmetsp:Transcript_23976/g.80884  ORF Transcript_23976/g.80884 Transcript_23976/m.80884 type:complete len:138 (+) Transcript_23976:665-1078(+)
MRAADYMLSDHERNATLQSTKQEAVQAGPPVLHVKIIFSGQPITFLPLDPEKCFLALFGVAPPLPQMASLSATVVSSRLHGICVYADSLVVDFFINVGARQSWIDVFGYGSAAKKAVFVGNQPVKLVICNTILHGSY